MTRFESLGGAGVSGGRVLLSLAQGNSSFSCSTLKQINFFSIFNSPFTTGLILPQIKMALILGASFFFSFASGFLTLTVAKVMSPFSPEKLTWGPISLSSFKCICFRMEEPF